MILPLLLTGTVIFVDASATGANDGSSWADAYTDLQSALSLPLGSAPDVWIAAGTYHPSRTGDRNASFWMQDAKLYGGFDGTETTLDQRAGLFDQTILDGDLLGDDGPNFASRQDNSCHVVVASYWQTVIDGLTIRGGYADRIGDPPWLGKSGAGLLAFYPARIDATECRFVDDIAVEDGGAVHADVPEWDEFHRCTFLGNAAGRMGGAVGGPPAMTRFDRCRFLGNQASTGGAVAGGSTFLGCLFSGNRARGGIGGGAIWIWDYIEVKACTFFGNDAVATRVGGGAIGSGYESWDWNSPAMTVANSIFWQNADASGQGFVSQIRTHPFHYFVHLDGSCVPEFHPIARGAGNLRTDPEFLDPLGPDGISGTLDDDLRLRASSPCIDRADDSFLPELGPLDLAGRDRAVDALSCGDGGVLDIGAYERQFVQGSTNYCEAASSSLGVPAVLSGPCAQELAAGSFGLSASPVPGGNGFFLFGPDRAETPFGDGHLCIGGALHRTDPLESQGGVLSTNIDFADRRFGAFLREGTCWSFQAVYRDRASTGAGFNLSDAIRVTFH